MQIIRSVAESYERQYSLNGILRKHVDGIIRAHADPKGWYYTSRLKEIESYALKIETGRVKDPGRLEDFFGCAIVVPNYAAVQEAARFVRGRFAVRDTRPPPGKPTDKPPESFGYDGLRLYCRLVPDSRFPATDPGGPLPKILFEIQIKTFFQHAWEVSTHDLIYKGGNLSWIRRRIAFQIKAMLEHAEVSIAAIDSMGKSGMLPSENREIARLNTIKDFLIRSWPRERLPDDLVRLATNIGRLLSRLGMDLDSLERHLEAETRSNRGTKTLHLTPYFAILQTIINRVPDLAAKLSQNASDDNRIAIPPEIDARALHAPGGGFARL